jgi:hypothetical protein
MAVILKKSVPAEIIGETPSGIKNGINTTFNTSLGYQLNTTKLYFNGRRLVLGVSADYTESLPNTIILNRIPEYNDYIVVDYRKA